MYHLFEASSANEVWIKIAEHFKSGIAVRGQESQSGMTDEILHAAISISDPRQRWIPARHPSINIAFALAEIVWILRGRNDSAFVNFFNTQLPKFAGNGPIYYGAYGHRIRERFGFDQLERAYTALKNNPHSRQVVLQIWDPASDFPDIMGRARDKDIPCNLISMIKVREGKLEWSQIMRSNDLFRGMPHNFIQFTFLQEILAGWLGLAVGSYHHMSDSLHFYHPSSAGEFSISTSSVANNADNVAIAKPDSDFAWKTLEELIESLIDKEVKIEDCMSLLSEVQIPDAFMNIGLVLTAEAARRKGGSNHIDALMSKCSNLAFCQMFANWLSRVGVKEAKH